MCSIIGTSKAITDLDRVNVFTKHRGPDRTVSASLKGMSFVHNLLSITGTLTEQPFVDESEKILALYNGEIYNYKDFFDVKSDGEILIPLYKEHGPAFIKKLDGEFALGLIDLEKDLLLLSTDAFATKPLWFAAENGEFGFATYKSCLDALGFSNPIECEPNTTYHYRLSSLELIKKEPFFDFDPSNQHKTDCDDFARAFEAAVEKRVRGVRENIFIGLSSGYDSGAIAHVLTKKEVPFTAYTITGKENKDVLQARHQRLARPAQIIDLAYDDYLRAKMYIKEHAQPYEFPASLGYKNPTMTDDPGAIGLSHICRQAKKAGEKIYLSGQGSDEILSDYGNSGKKLRSHSTFGGRFPDDLAPVFPWLNFYGGAQRGYLAKEEYVAGSYGMETRYPFLDPQVVQEFLWLHPSIKNKAYKYPLKWYLNREGYPIDEGNKMGFVLPSFSVMTKLLPHNLFVRGASMIKRLFRLHG